VYSQIFARSDMNDTGSGKTMRVWSDVNQLKFSVDSAKHLFIIKARCYESVGTGEFGGFINEISRSFLLELEKAEVEKLVHVAVKEKLLKQLGIINLHLIDRSSSLEVKIEKLKFELKSARDEIKKLERKINRAKHELEA